MRKKTSGHVAVKGYQLVGKRQTRFAAMAALLACLLWAGPVTPPALAAGPRIAALGDSLTAGYGLPADEAFPAQLEKALAARGRQATIVNFGVSGDTTAGGLARLGQVLAMRPDGVILELGANDMLRGQDPESARAGLEAVMKRLSEAGIPVLVCGMRAARNFGADYAAEFDAVYPELAKKYDALLYPFFLDGVAGRPDLTQPDGLHPTARGVAEVVARILPTAEAFLDRIDRTKAQNP
ncbi:arylesterase [Solidesulfovibrio sp.]|uniref:arylesterase n=1 Tax=Solidesulfovibrio sp. TaxID=2910990 RepID=UPI0026042249|nr:arylesterase [Solidesulfovibrio sp.]